MEMSKSKKVRYICRGYLRLSEDEKKEVLRIINEHNNKVEGWVKQADVLTFNQSCGLDLGPVGSVCPCCGR